jgi:hypothetical protein
LTILFDNAGWIYPKKKKSICHSLEKFDRFSSLFTVSDRPIFVYLLKEKASRKMNTLYLKDYRMHPDAKINPSLLWEHDLSRFDFQAMKNLVVQRVVERGWPSDWHAILNRYGENGVRDAIMEIPYLNDKDLNFVSKAFEIPLLEMKCYIRRPSHLNHWNA